MSATIPRSILWLPRNNQQTGKTLSRFTLVREERQSELISSLFCESDVDLLAANMSGLSREECVSKRIALDINTCIMHGDIECKVYPKLTDQVLVIVRHNS